jgi:hypothetical protein
VNCGGVNATEKGLDAHVRSELFRFLSGAKLHPQVRGPEQDEAALRRELDVYRQRLDELVLARFPADSADPPLIRTNREYEAALMPLHASIDRTNAALAALADEQRRVDAVHGLRPGKVEDLETWWSTATDVAKREAVREYIVRVEVSKAKRRGGNVFDPSRVSIGFDWSMLARVASKAWDEGTGMDWAVAVATDREAKFDPVEELVQQVLDAHPELAGRVDELRARAAEADESQAEEDARGAK